MTIAPPAASLVAATVWLVVACGSSPGAPPAPAGRGGMATIDGALTPVAPPSSTGETPGSGPDAAAPTRADADAAAGPPADAAAAAPALPPASDGLTQLLQSRAIGLGYYHSCLITPDHQVSCLGNKAEDDPRVHPPAGLRAEQIAGAHNGFCVIPVARAAALPAGTLPLSVTARRLTCWGHKDTFFPPANLDMDPVQVGIGYDHGCVLNADHSVLCWGQAGTSNKPPEGLKARSLAVAAFFSCAIKQDDDTVVCWGIAAPTPPPGLKAKLVAAIYHGNNKLPEAASGTSHACAIQLDDTVVCWGTSVMGNLDVPADLGPARDLAVATSDSCALRMNGEPVCWGTSKYDGMDPARYHPMPTGLHLKAIRAKLATYCGIKMEDDTVVCWGDEQHDHISFPPGGVKLYVP
jgi:hypothetical protein